jgi:hypothetical protein
MFNSPAIRRAFGELFGLARETTSPGEAAFAFSGCAIFVLMVGFEVTVRVD